jgi:ubiquinone biosynthesis protein COQ4
MRTSNQRYSYKPRNPFRTLLALWRVLREGADADANIEEATIVQFAFNRSRWGRNIARWDLLAQEVAASSPEADVLMKARVRMPEIDLDRLFALPAGTLGHEFAHCAMKRGINPNAVQKMPSDTDGDWLMAYSYETHDLWHLLSGFYYNLEGEFGVAGFYMGQIPKYSFIAFFTSILLLKIVWNDRDAIATHVAAFANGYELGSKAKCLIGLDWAAVFDRDLEELREEWGVRSADRFPTMPAIAA